ncbi:MAG: N-terminal methylation motif domain-containing protein [Parcubacteria group bacterium Athens0714_16]|nr:MAG: N-terminal methylation motif domain-containing protein [Parcubacteria group bacterium Athens0714_16]
MKKNKGFTLIELLVVIAIIGILSSVVLASLNSARQKSRDARRIADIKQVQLALELYFDSNANYPTALAPLAPSFIPTLPKDPQTDTVYTYTALGSGTTCSSYHLMATLEDGNHQALDGDADAAAGTACTGGGIDAIGTDPLYDVKP